MPQNVSADRETGQGSKRSGFLDRFNVFDNTFAALKITRFPTIFSGKIVPEIEK